MIRYRDKSYDKQSNEIEGEEKTTTTDGRVSGETERLRVNEQASKKKRGIHAKVKGGSS